MDALVQDRATVRNVDVCAGNARMVDFRAEPTDLHAVFAATPGLNLLLAADPPYFTMIAASDECLAATMSTHADTIGRPFFEVFSDANPANMGGSGVANLRASLEKVLRTGIAHRMPTQRFDLKRPDGSWEERYWELRHVPVFGAHGSVRFIVHQLEDVTARVRQRQAAETAWQIVEEEHARAEVILETMGEAHYVMDRDFRILTSNAAMERALGMPRAKWVGRTQWEAFPGSLGTLSEINLRRVVQERVPMHWTQHYTDSVHDLDTDIDAYPTAEGGVAVFWRDVTERERAAAAKQDAERERERLLEVAESERARAEAANLAKSEFLAVMSHELRTPLNAIDGYAELLELGLRGPLTDAQREDIARIRKSQRHLLGLINGVLNYAKVDAGAVQYDVEDVPLDEVLTTCEALVAPQAKAKGITLDSDECHPSLVAVADREKVQQVVLNLLSNALKFTGHGGHVSLGCAALDEERVAVWVSDDGRGIAPQQLERVFQPFVQVDAGLTRTQEGVGLGLAISRDLARGMGGDLVVQSKPGVGSVFTVTLPTRRNG